VPAGASASVIARAFAASRTPLTLGLIQLGARARRHTDRRDIMLARTRAVLSACSAAVVILVSAGVSASFELNQVRTTPYGWLENSCGSGNAMPGDCISTTGQAQRFRANISSDGSFEHPTTLAVAAQCLQGRRACPITRSGYLRSGDLVFVPDLGWFRVEDTCGACEAGRANAGAIALWTATASATELNRANWSRGDRPSRCFIVRTHTGRPEKTEG
jgi:hypothetical protein